MFIFSRKFCTYCFYFTFKPLFLSKIKVVKLHIRFLHTSAPLGDVLREGQVGQALWKKKSNTEFDVGLGSFDGAECCDLVGLYMLSQLQHLNINLGKYRDDALGVTSMTPRQADIAKKEICKIYKQNSLSIEIQVNAKTVDFLDINLDLRTGIYKPFMKPNDCPTYIHKHSNHPPSIIRNIPESVNKRLCGISANEEIFKNAIPPYQAALIKSGKK